MSAAAATKSHGFPKGTWTDFCPEGKADAKAKATKAADALGRLQIGPLDRANAELLDKVHPVEWVAPDGIPVYNMVALGAGAGGLVTCGSTSRAGGKAALIEKHLLGGDCLNIGCVPSKALLSAAKCAHKCREAHKWGVEVKDVKVNFPKVMERMREIRAHISENDSVQRFTNTLGVDVYIGTGKFLDRETIQVGERRIKFKKACIATGGRARIPPVFKDVKYRTNATIFNLTKLPGKLAVIGSGPIGCELGQAFARFGSKVSIFSRRGVVMGKEDREAAAIVEARMSEDGVRFVAATTESATQKGGQIEMVYKDTKTGAVTTELFDEVLLSAGRVPNVEGLGLEAAGVAYTSRGVTVNDFLQTTNPNIYATGDVCLEEQFTHMSGTSAVLVTDNALKGMRRKYSDFVIPRVTFTEPEVAHVGLSKEEIVSRLGEGNFHEFKRPFNIVDRNLTDGYTDGFCKMFTKKDSDEILGCTIVGHQAGEMIAMVTTAIVGNCGALTIAKIISPYPTMHENVKFTAAGYRGTLPSDKPKFTKILEAEREGKGVVPQVTLKAGALAVGAIAVAAIVAKQMTARK